MDFRTLAAEGTWNHEACFDTFLHRLSKGVKNDLAARELLTELVSLNALTIRIDGRHREHKREKRSDPNRSLNDLTLHLMNSGSPRRLRPRFQFLLMEFPVVPVVLGLFWLQRNNPSIFIYLFYFTFI